jgi:hypothetical protein
MVQVKKWPYLAGHAKQFVRITVKGIQFGDAYAPQLFIVIILLLTSNVI